MSHAWPHNTWQSFIGDDDMAFWEFCHGSLKSKAQRQMIFNPRSNLNIQSEKINLISSQAQAHLLCLARAWSKPQESLLKLESYFNRIKHLIVALHLVHMRQKSTKIIGWHCQLDTWHWDHCKTVYQPENNVGNDKKLRTKSNLRKLEVSLAYNRMLLSSNSSV